ncbi:MAG: DinB family protein [Flavobacteriales bacterium]|nr:DinB family protein [Flavobacteriales bacterium]
MPTLSNYTKAITFGTEYLLKLVDGFDEEDWFYSHEESNNAHWNLGHIVEERTLFLQSIGVDVSPNSWESMFTFGEEPNEEQSSVSAEELIEALRQREKELVKALPYVKANMNLPLADEEWPIWDEFKTAEDYMNFNLFHEGYHIGQIGIVRKMRGKGRLM